MRPFTTVLLLLAASPVPAVAQAQGPVAGPASAPAVAARAPRETVQAVATRIRDLYFDPTRADEIAKGLEAAAAAGEFDALTDPRDLATALTVRLKPLDAHFNVVFDSRRAAITASGAFRSCRATSAISTCASSRRSTSAMRRTPPGQRRTPP